MEGVSHGNVHLYMAPPSPGGGGFHPPSPHFLRSPVQGYVLTSPDWRGNYLRVADPLAVGYLTPQPMEVSSPTALTAEHVHSDRELIIMRAKDVTQQLIMESDPLVAAEVFKAGLEILGHAPPPAVANERGGNGSSAGRGVSNAGITDAAAAFSGVKLVHPDEFKNPSTFLKIYGDPLCFSRLGPLPKKDRNGNWECQDCGNVNFPRRFRCNMCQKARSPEGDQLVAEYAAQVYERYQQLFKQQKDPSASLSTPDGMQIHYKTNRANNKKKSNLKHVFDRTAHAHTDRSYHTDRTTPMCVMAIYSPIIDKQSAQHAAPVPAPSRSPPSTAPQSTVSEVTNGDPAVSESDYISAKYTTPQSSYY